MRPEPHAGSNTTPWSGSMTLTMVCTSDGGVKNSPLSCAPSMANFIRKYSIDATEDVAAGSAEGITVEDTQKVFEHGALKNGEVLGQLPLERFELSLDSV